MRRAHKLLVTRRVDDRWTTTTAHLEIYSYPLIWQSSWASLRFMMFLIFFRRWKQWRKPAGRRFTWRPSWPLASLGRWPTSTRPLLFAWWPVPTSSRRRLAKRASTQRFLLDWWIKQNFCFQCTVKSQKLLAVAYALAPLVFLAAIRLFLKLH